MQSNRFKKWKEAELIILFSHAPTKENIAMLAEKFKRSRAAIRIKFKTPYSDGRFSASPLQVKVRQRLGLPAGNWGNGQVETPHQSPNVIEDLTRQKRRAGVPKLALPKGLRLFSNRGYYQGIDGFIYVFAPSVAKAARLTKNVTQPDGAWFDVDWNISMEKVVPETGVWFVPFEHFGDEKFEPIKVA